MAPSALAHLKAFLKDARVGSVSPSSRFVVARVLKGLGRGRARVIVEYGAADGVMTRGLLRRLAAGGRLLAIESNRRLFDSLNRLRDTRLSLCRGDVRRIGAIAREHAISGADAVVSGVPLSLFSAAERRRLVDGTFDLLKPGGRFIAYQATPYLMPLLKKRFAKVKTEFELRNIPPLLVFTAVK